MSRMRPSPYRGASSAELRHVSPDADHTEGTVNSDGVVSLCLTRRVVHGLRLFRSPGGGEV